jgi:hypothetical protein
MNLANLAWRSLEIFGEDKHRKKHPKRRKRSMRFWQAGLAKELHPQLKSANHLSTSTRAKESANGYVHH